ncbi:hypothetical protein QJS10_CPA10g01878 [Acorus calamus]|uniref:Threonyl/alanyl tRNA synthetase SAD domain-containing protein n=1 Tax=Acorus calamus TaxID=4465 RepID=A0AAV9DYY9_ACOCL|nr:hypothetical protein QJS10_CPA10g01878 [Acorus calamus]
MCRSTSPPSFALEVFVRCEGEPRFRRLCQPFLYSHSSSNVLEVEPVVSNHLVVRGTYRSLTLVVYGNTAEDLGQFNIEVDIGCSGAYLPCSPSEEQLEDLPPVFRMSKLTFEESICYLRSLSLAAPKLDLSVGMKQFLQLILKICQIPEQVDEVYKIISTVVPAVSSIVMTGLCSTTFTQEMDNLLQPVDERNTSQPCPDVLLNAKNALLLLYKTLQNASGNVLTDLLGEEIIIESADELATTQVLIDMLNQNFPYKGNTSSVGNALVCQNKYNILGLSVVLLLCSAREGCSCFVNSGGMDHIINIFSHEIQKSTVIPLMLLAIVEQATRHASGCEGFLGWWPREDENVPVGRSDGYNIILKLLLQKQRHDVASLATCILHRLHLYEIASRYEFAVLSALADPSSDCTNTSDRLSSLFYANSQLKKLSKLLNVRGPVEDPSPGACGKKLSDLGQAEGMLSYRATIDLIASSKYRFERGFLPLSAALLSSSTLRSAFGSTVEVLVEIAASVESIILSLLACRSGLIFLLLQPEATATVIYSLQGNEDFSKEESVPLRYATALISKGFMCHPQEVKMIIELHLRVGNTIDRLLSATSYSEDFLWILLELCALSRSEAGRQALLVPGTFPEAVSLLIEALQSFKELELMASSTGNSSLGLSILHSAAELLEVIVSDSASSSLCAWIGHATELHKSLHMSSPGSNRKDAPTRLLEWIDAGVVYHRNGAIGLLRYAAILASGGDAHLTSTSILVSDSMDIENVVGDSTGGSDSQVMDNLLGKLVSDKSFDGVTLNDTSIVQLTTTFRILAFISENSAVAASLYEEGVMTLIYVVLVNCKSMLEKSSSTYDYLVDEGAECSSTSDMLLERSREKCLVDLLIPSLVLLLNLLQKLQFPGLLEVGESEFGRQDVIQVSRGQIELVELSNPRLMTCPADLSSLYPGSALGFAAVCRLLVSALAFWPVSGWIPGLFPSLFKSVRATSLLALGPKDACSMLCLLGDIFAEEDIWLWKCEMPSLSALRTLSIGTLLGALKEQDIEWYSRPGYQKVLLSQMAQELDEIAEVVLHFAFSVVSLFLLLLLLGKQALVVVQDMLRVFIIRVAYQNSETAVGLLQPLFSWLLNHVSDTYSLLDTDVYKGRRALASIFLPDHLSPFDDNEWENGGVASLSHEYNWKSSPPFLGCWMKLLQSLDLKDCSSLYAIEAVNALSLAGLYISMEGKSVKGLSILKSLFGLSHDLDGSESSLEDQLKNLHDMIPLLDRSMSENEHTASSTRKTTLCQVKKSVNSMLLLFQKPEGTVLVEDLVSASDDSSSRDVVSPVNLSTHSLMQPLTLTSMVDEISSLSMQFWKSDEIVDNPLNFAGIVDKFMWECPDSLERQTMPAKRKVAPVESLSKRARDTPGPEGSVSNAFPRGLGASTASSVPTRRDAFRQRKPNTSRPPSMHVDDYVARERNFEGSSASNTVGSSQRGGSSGRPPSIHVDEFMARQRERQNPVSPTVGEVPVRNSSVEASNDPDRTEKSQRLTANLDDDLHGIDIVFDEESESDDKLPFPQPDDNLQPAPVIIGESSPGSVVEETESDVIGSTQMASEDGSSHHGFPLRRSVSRQEVSMMGQESSMSSKMKNSRANGEKPFFHEQSDESKYAAAPPISSNGLDAFATNLPSFPTPFYNMSNTSSSIQLTGESRLPPPPFYPRGSPQKSMSDSLPTISQGFYEQKPPLSQPPLPPLPPPVLSSMQSQPSDSPIQGHPSFVSPPLPGGYPPQASDVNGGHGAVPVFYPFPDSLSHPSQLQIQSEHVTSVSASQPMQDQNFTWLNVSTDTNSSGGLIRLQPPLPPTPPPFSAASVTPASSMSISSLLYRQTHTGAQLPLTSTSLPYSMPSLTPSLVLNRPSLSGNLFGSHLQLQQQQQQQMTQSRPPPQPPQPPRPPQPPQLPRPPSVQQQQSELGVPVLHHPMHSPQHLQMPQLVYYQPQQDPGMALQPPLIEHVQSSGIHQSVDNSHQQQQDSGAALLKQYFSSPEAIQVAAAEAASPESVNAVAAPETEKVVLPTNESSEWLLRIRHTCAHVMAMAVQKLFPNSKVTIGNEWWDLCAGPHVESTGKLNKKAIELESVAGAYWRGDESKPMLRRIYGTSWENEEQLKAYLHFKEEAKRRDHRRLGQELDLFSIQMNYCREVVARLKENDIRAELCHGERLPKLIRNAEKQKVPLMAVVGPKEAESKTVTIRSRLSGELGTMAVDEFIRQVLIDAKCATSSQMYTLL